MATGDIKNNLRKLTAELKCIRYDKDINYEQLIIGLVEPYLPILHYLFVDYSQVFSEYLSSKGFEFYGKTDSRFIDLVYKVVVQEFQFKPLLTKPQFFAVGFAEVKIIFVTKILYYCKEKVKHILSELALKRKQHCKSFNSGAVSKVPIHKVVKEDIEVLNVGPINQCMANNISQQLPAKNLLNEPFISTCHLLDVTDFDGSFNEGTVTDNADDADDDIAESLNDTEEKGHKEELSEKDNLSTVFLPEFKVIKHPLDDNGKIEDRSKKVMEFQHGVNDVHLCGHCKSTAQLVNDIHLRVEKLEIELREEKSYNRNLNSCMTIMNAQIKILQNAVTKFELSNKTKDNILSENKNICNTMVECEYNKDFMRHTLEDDESSDYSPIKYTDDDEVLRNFKPIRMEDIYDSQSLNNENIRNTDFVERDSALLPNKTLINSDKNISNSGKNVSSSDKSLFIDSHTSQIVQSLQERLKQTEMLLSSNSIQQS